MTGFCLKLNWSRSNNLKPKAKRRKRKVTLHGIDGQIAAGRSLTSRQMSPHSNHFRGL